MCTCVSSALHTLQRVQSDWNERARAFLRAVGGVTNLVAGPPTRPKTVVALTPQSDGRQNPDGALCDVRTPRRQRCSKKLSFMHR
jgi:hypothetical protein